MSELTVNLVLAAALCLVPLGERPLAAENAKDSSSAFRKAQSPMELDERIESLKGFIAEHTDSELCDDALLQILEGMIERNDAAGARRIVRELEAHPEGIMRRQLLIGDPDVAVVEQWKKFTEKNPIRSLDWARWLFARYLASQGKLSEATAIARQLLRETRRPWIPKDIHHSALATEDIRDNVIRLCFRIAEKRHDQKFLAEVKKIAKEEYKAEDDDLAAAIPLLQIYRMRQGDHHKEDSAEPPL